MPFKFLKVADLYGPKDLLENAKHLLESNDLKVMRAVVLESMTALEVYVHTKVFKVLEKRLNIEFVEWLKKTTNLNFDSRLGVITPLALGFKISIVKQSDLWRRYKKARKIRNKVSHDGKIINFDEAQEVYNTVYDWLGCLGSNIGIEIALMEFKQSIEANQISISTESEGIDLINIYFKSSSVATTYKFEFERRGPRIDYVLKFGAKLIGLEMKLLLKEPLDLHIYIKNEVSLLNNVLEHSTIDKIALIIFLNGRMPGPFHEIRRYKNGRILVAVIKIEAF